MKLYGIIIIAVRIVEAYSASRFSVHGDNRPLMNAAGNIVDRCFSSFDRWSELLIIPEHESEEILKIIHRASNTANLIVSLHTGEENRFPHYGNRCDYCNNSDEGVKVKPTAVIITSIHSLKQLESVLNFLKNDYQRLWSPGSYFLIVLEKKCDAAECNDMFKVMWNYWILNVVILCSSNDPADLNQSEFQLYTYNPYSVDHGRQWKIVIHETVEVFIHTGNFNHPWYIFKHKFAGNRSSKNCDDIFFDKTLNLDGYVIPVSIGEPAFFSNTTASGVPRWYEIDRLVVTTVAKILRFELAQVSNNHPSTLGQVRVNGSYSGVFDDIFYGRSNFHSLRVPTNVHNFGFGTTYPHTTNGVCFVSRIVGLRSQWENLADAKYIWIALGVGTLFVTVFLYLQNKSYGIVSAFLDAERLVIGNSVIRTSTGLKHRIILGSIFFVVLVVDGTMRGRFISALTIAKPYPNIDTLQQLKNQNVDMYGHSNLQETLIDPELKARFNTSVWFAECLEALEREKHQRACFVTCRSMPFLTWNSSTIHIASNPIMTYYVWTISTLHWPMLDRYSNEILKLGETGIFRKWQLDLERECEVNSWKWKRAVEPPYVRPIRLNDLLPAFMLLFVGLSAAIMIFISEKRDRENIQTEQAFYWKSFFSTCLVPSVDRRYNHKKIKRVATGPRRNLQSRNRTREK